MARLCFKGIFFSFKLLILPSLNIIYSTENHLTIWTHYILDLKIERFWYINTSSIIISPIVHLKLPLQFCKQDLCIENKEG